MKTYEVIIKATIYKTITVKAENEDEAYIQAHERFSVLNDDTPEQYEQDSVGIEEVQEAA